MTLQIHLIEENDDHDHVAYVVHVFDEPNHEYPPLLQVFSQYSVDDHERDVVLLKVAYLAKDVFHELNSPCLEMVLHNFLCW